MVLSNTNDIETDLFDPKALRFLVRVGLGVMAFKIYSTLLMSPKLKTHHWRQFSVIQRTPFFSGELLASAECSQFILRSTDKEKIIIRILDSI